MKLLILTLFVCFSLNAKIVTTSQIEEALPYIDQDTWVLVDLDNCLFEAAQSLGHANWFYDELVKKMAEGLTKDEAIASIYPEWVKIQKVCKVKPLEEAFIPYLISLQTKGITIMGLTHRQPIVADSTLKQVASLGFDFRLTAPSQETLVIPAKTHTLYINGILFVGDYNKKIDIFCPFLEQLNKYPTKIVFIDDKRKNVEELEALSQRGIDYIGIHYTAIETNPPTYKRELAEYQYKHFNQILSNEATETLIERGL